MADEIKYEYKTVQTVRGTDGLVISKMQKDGWELVEQLPGKLRTTLNFRRPKKPLPRLLIGAGAAVLVVLAAIIGTGAALSDGDEEKDAPASSGATSEKPSATPTPTAAAPTAAAVITPQNNTEFAALLKADPCDEANLDFATKHEGQTVAFDGSIRHMAPHGDYHTRYDFLLGPGDKGPQTTDGPNFKYEDVNTGNLNLTGKQIPATVGVGDKFRFVAEVGEFNADQCLFFLAPVSTEIR
ncbi:DUF4839 domain-containing protein [Streptomyces sp. NPDC046860]|uniref:DUF4839 domain-containing protein n=1 Tax=Streptomyces sp. NPDC046860 TaxID=3154495 RepID=UPI0033F6E6BA